MHIKSLKENVNKKKKSQTQNKELPFKIFVCTFMIDIPIKITSIHLCKIIL